MPLAALAHDHTTWAIGRSVGFQLVGASRLESPDTAVDENRMEWSRAGRRPPHGGARPATVKLTRRAGAKGGLVSRSTLERPFAADLASAATQFRDPRPG